MKGWIPVTVNKIKGGIIALLMLSLSFNILFILALTFLVEAEKTETLLVWGILTAFYFCVAWLLPLWVYLRLPVKVRFSDSELIIQNGMKREKYIQRENIIKVVPMRAVISKDIIYGVYYNSKKTGVTSFDEKSGRYVWEWYYGKEKNIEQLEP